MPVTPVNINLAEDEEEVVSKLRSTLGDSKAANEVYHAFDALGVWREWFESQHGPLNRILHHTNPDDPPDMELCFERIVVPLEHTQLKPHPYGMFDVIHRREHPDMCVSVPPLSKKYRSRTDIENEMFNDTGEWVAVADEQRAWLREFMQVVERKTRFCTPGVLLVYDTSLLTPGEVRQLARGFNLLLGRRIMPHLSDWIILLHSRLNSVQYISYLLRHGFSLEERLCQ